MQTDEQLLTRVTKGEEPAFDVLYDRYHESIYRLVLRMVRAADLAEDIVQEVFLKVWQKSEQWNGRGSVRGWIGRIATNLSLNFIETAGRRAKRHIPILQRDNDEDTFSRLADTVTLGPAEAYIRKETLLDLETSVAQLSEEKQVVLSILLREDVTLTHISERLGVPLGTVKSRIFNATRELRGKFLSSKGEG